MSKNDKQILRGRKYEDEMTVKTGYPVIASYSMTSAKPTKKLGERLICTMHQFA